MQKFKIKPVYKKFLFWNKVVNYNIVLEGNIIYHNLSEDTAKHICDALNEEKTY